MNNCDINGNIGKHPLVDGCSQWWLNRVGNTHAHARVHQRNLVAIRKFRGARPFWELWTDYLEQIEENRSWFNQMMGELIDAYQKGSLFRPALPNAQYPSLTLQLNSLYIYSLSRLMLTRAMVGNRSQNPRDPRFLTPGRVYWQIKPCVDKASKVFWLLNSLTSQRLIIALRG